jgi:peptidoglycan hydrolase-like protein with peptidoglycan-binding domain
MKKLIASAVIFFSGIVFANALSTTAGFSPSYIAPNTQSVKIGSFVFQAAAGESVRINSVSVTLAITNAATANYSNLTLKTGSVALGAPIGSPTGGVNTFSFNDVIVPGSGMMYFDVYADVGSDTDAAVTADMSVTARGAVSNTLSVSSGNGVAITSVLPVLASPTLQSSSPASQFVSGSSAFGVATFKVATVLNGTQANVREMRFSVVGGNVIESITVNGITAPVVGSAATISGLAIPVGSTGTDIPVSVTFSGFQNSTSGGTLQTSVSGVKISLNYVEAGVNGFTITNSSPASSNAMTLVASKPTVAVAAGNVDTLVLNAESKIGEFTVTADANGKIALTKASVSLFAVGVTNPLFSSLRIADGTATIPNATVSGTTIATINFNSPYEISAGQSKTFSLYGIVTGAVQAGVVPYVSSYLTSSATFTWNDILGGNTAENGSLILNFPTSSFTTNRSGIQVPTCGSNQTLVNGTCVDNVTPTPTNPSCLTFTVDMRIGSTDQTTGGQVTKLQDFLIAGGYLNIKKGTAPGVFGKQTAEAVVKFQRANGITQNGLVGPLTRAKIMDLSCSSTTTPASVDLKVNNSDGPLVLTKPQSVTLRWTSTGVTNCDIYVSGSAFQARDTVDSNGTRTRSVNPGLNNYISLNCNKVSSGEAISDIVVISSATTTPSPAVYANITKAEVAGNPKKLTFSGNTNASGLGFAVSDSNNNRVYASDAVTITNGNFSGTAILSSTSTHSEKYTLAIFGTATSSGTDYPTLDTKTFTVPPSTSTQDTSDSPKSTCPSGTSSVNGICTGPIPGNLLPKAQLSQTSSVATSGEPFSITLTSLNVASCVVTYTGPDGGGTISNGPINGTLSISPYVVGTYTVRASCTGGNGSIIAEPLTHVVTSSAVSGKTNTTPAPTIALTKDKDASYGGTITIGWTVTPSSGVTCVAAGGDLAAGIVIGTTGHWKTPPLYTTTQYGMKCTTDASGLSTYKYITVTVPQQTGDSTSSAAPTITLTSNAPGAYGKSVTLSWNVTPATGVTCASAGGNIAPGTAIATTGSWQTPNLYTTTSYGIQCTNTSNNLTSYKYVTVAVPSQISPTAKLTQSNSSTNSGAKVTLKLSSTNATSCVVTYSGPEGEGTISNGPTNPEGSFTPTVAGTYTVKAVCTGDGGTANSSVTHTVTAPKSSTSSASPTTSGDSCATLNATKYYTDQCCTTSEGTQRCGTQNRASDSCAALTASEYYTNQCCTTSVGTTRCGTKPLSSNVMGPIYAMGESGTVLGAATQCTDLSYNFHRGYEASAVGDLQNFLIAKGFLSSEATGFYGDQTVEAVKSYQSSKNLPITGMVYDFTRAAIKADSCQ